MVETQTQYSDAFKDAVICRASGVGLVPYSLLSKLSREEWGQVRLMNRTDAFNLLKTFSRNSPLPESARTKTPTLDPKILEELRKF